MAYKFLFALSRLCAIMNQLNSSRRAKRPISGGETFGTFCKGHIDTAFVLCGYESQYITTTIQTSIYKFRIIPR